MTWAPGPAPQDAMVAPPPDGGQEFSVWRRVDPRTLLMLAGPLLLLAVFVLIALVSGRSDEGGGALFQFLFPVVGGLAALVRYLTGYYAVTDGAVQWKVGLLVRKSTQIGIERLQDVEVTRPLLARVLGLAAVNVSSAGGSGEIKLMFLDHATAERLGHYLQHLITVQRHAHAAEGYPIAGATAGGSVAPGVVPQPAVEIHKVSNSELASWIAYRTWPLAAGLVLAAIGMLLAGVPPVWFALLPLAPLGGVSAVKTVFDRVGMSVSIDATSLYTREGLTTVRRTSTQRERVQLVVAHRLWLQGLRGSETVRYASADVTANKGEGSVRAELALNVPIGSWSNFASTLAHRQVVGDAALRRKPAAVAAVTRLRWSIAGLAAGAVAGAAIAAVLVGADLVDDGPVWAGAVVTGGLVLVVTAIPVVVLGLVRAARRRSAEGWAVTPDDLLVVSGILRRKTILLFAEKTQAVEVLSGPLQRRLGLVTVVVDTAPPGRFTQIAIRDITISDAEELLASLTASGTIPLPNGV